MPNINLALAQEVRKVLDENKAERHIRGGIGTKLKYIRKHKLEEKKWNINVTKKIKKWNKTV